MSGLLRILGRERLWPLWVVLGLGLLLVPRLGSYGFWEPQEMKIAAQALPASSEDIEAAKTAERAAKARDAAQLRSAAKKAALDKGMKAAGAASYQPNAEALAAAAAKRHAIKERREQHPPLTDKLATLGISTLGSSEFGARTPFVLLALIAGLATFFLGRRVRSPRAGLLAVLILAACPLFLFQARQLTSELGTLAGGALMALGAVGLCSPWRGRPVAMALLDLVWVFVGAALSYYNSGFFVGLFPPVLAVALATATSAFSSNPEPRPHDTRSAPAHLKIAASLSAILAVVAVYYFTSAVFEWVKAGDSEFSLFGKIYHSNGQNNPLLAGAWKKEGNLKFDFDSLFSQVAFGLFPWICVAPIAVTKMASGGERGTNALGARLLFAWASIAWLISTIALRKIGPVQYPAVVAIAVSIAVWLDQILCARKLAEDTAGGDETHSESAANRVAQLAPPLVAMFTLFAVLILARDIEQFPEQFLSLHLDSPIKKFPEGVALHKWLLILGGLFGLSFSSWLLFWTPTTRRQRRERWRQFLPSNSLIPVLGLSLAISVFLSQIWTPGLSTKLSSRSTFGVFRSLYEMGYSLAIVGKASDGAKFYANAPYEILNGRPALIKFLEHPERVFVLANSSELCPLHKDSTRLGFDYYVVDDSNADKIMLSNRMWSQDVPPPPKLRPLMRSFLDRNPLTRFLVRSEPPTIQTPLNINFDNKLQLIGVDMPATAVRGSSFRARLYYKVLKPIRRNFKVFVHFDGDRVRFQGDHWPVQKRCGTNFWQPGTFVIDEFTVEAGNRSNPRTDYKIWTGLFVGSAGNWENMKAVSGDPDDNNRVQIGSLRLE